MKNLTSSQLALESIGISLSQTLAELSRGDVAALVFMQSYHESRVNPEIRRLLTSIDTAGWQAYRNVNDKAVLALARLRRRATLTAAIGIWDSFLSDSVRFWLLHDRERLQALLPTNGKLDDAPLHEQLEFVVRRKLKTWKARLDFLTKKLQLSIDPAALEELEILIDLRNQVAHHVGMYAFGLDSRTGMVRAEARPVPDVTRRHAMAASMHVTELADAILVALSTKLHSRVPKVRPMTDLVRQAHDMQREAWQKEDATPREVEDVTDPKWKARFDRQLKRAWVEDRMGLLRIIYTGIESYPAMIRFLPQTIHGTEAVFAVDGRTERTIWSGELLREMLHGEEITVDYRDADWERPRLVKLSLEGFRDAWDEAAGLR